jgi:hypothetical protein
MVSEIASFGVYKRMGFGEFFGHTRWPASGRKWNSVWESDFLSLGRITKLKKVGLDSVSS